MTYKSRAETVARTEVVSAYNGAAAGFAREHDHIAGLEWIATLDSRTRLSHAALDGTIIRKGEAFHIDGATIRYPGDPEVFGVPDPGSIVINCRCTCAPVLAEDMPGADAAAAA
jgi:SPP1 gp7 family putative phage head morphogenesis protein